MTIAPASATRRVIRSDCPSCGSAGVTQPFVSRADSEWSSCRCGLVFLHSADEKPMPAVVPDTTPAAAVGAAPGYQAYEHRRRRRVWKARQQILDVLNHAAPGPLLDIGSSLGYTLRAAAGLGMAATGVEIDPAVVQRCRAQGFDVHQATMDRLPFDDGRFQIVVMKHVLEHTPQPRQALAEVRRVLKPGGGLFIAVPDLRYHKAMRNPHTHRFFSLAGDGTGDGHYVYYTPDSLRKLLESMQFRVAKIEPHLYHRHAPLLRRTGQIALAPAAWTMQRVFSKLHLRKEFWLVATRP